MNLLQGQEAAAVDLHVRPEADEQVGQVHDFQREGRSQRKTGETRTIRKVDSGEKSAVLTSWFHTSFQTFCSFVFILRQICS